MAFDLERELAEKTNEIARLLEEANNWHQHYRDERRKAQSWKEWGFKQQDEATRFRDALELIANATGGDNARYYQELAQIALSEVALTTAPEEPVIQDFRITEPEWRIKEKGEIIEAGDQYNSPMRGWVSAPWVGEKIETAGRIRTRRPLPKQEEMPLVKMMECFLGDYPEAGKAIYDAIYNLRDDIQKLKEAK